MLPYFDNNFVIDDYKNVIYFAPKANNDSSLIFLSVRKRLCKFTICNIFGYAFGVTEGERSDVFTSGAARATEQNKTVYREKNSTALHFLSGVWPSGKASEFESAIQRFESFHPRF